MTDATRSGANTSVSYDASPGARPVSLKYDANEQHFELNEPAPRELTVAKTGTFNYSNIFSLSFCNIKYIKNKSHQNFLFLLYIIKL